MAKTLLYRLFGIGKIPPSYRPKLEREGILFCDEGIKCSTTYRKFRGAGRASLWRREGFTGSIILTQTRLIAFAYSRPVIDIPLADERIHSLSISIKKPHTLCFSFNAAVFNPDWSGTLEERFSTPLAQSFVEQLQTLLSPSALK